MQAFRVFIPFQAPKSERNPIHHQHTAPVGAILNHQIKVATSAGMYPFLKLLKPNTTLIACPVPGTYYTLLKSRFDEEIGSAITQQFAYAQQLGLPFPSYEEEDILKWDVAIATPPPRSLGTLRVKLKYTGRSKPIPIEDPWAE